MYRINGKSRNVENSQKPPKMVPIISHHFDGLDIDELWIVYAILEKNPKTTWEYIAKKVGLSRRQLYNWRQSERIQKAVFNISRDLLLTEIPDVYRTLVKRAKEGDVGAMKLFFEIIEKGNEQRVQENREESPAMVKLMAAIKSLKSPSIDTSERDKIHI